MRLYFASRRSRRTFAQVTHILLPLVNHPDDTWSFQQRAAEASVYDFHSVWLVARIFLEREAEPVVHIARLMVQEVLDGTVKLSDPGEATEVFPSEYHPPRKPRQPTEDIDRLEGKDRKKKKRRLAQGGVKRLPNTNLPARVVEVAIGDESDESNNSSDSDSDETAPSDTQPVNRANRRSHQPPQQGLIQGGRAASSTDRVVPGLRPGPAPANVAPPPSADVAQPRPRRRARVDGDVAWHGWIISPIYRSMNSERVHVGWGAVCGRHDLPRLECKIQATFGESVSHDDCLNSVKQWLVRGLQIPAGGENRPLHVPGMRPRSFPKLSEEQVEALYREFAAAGAS